jgi:hypothetical protein
VSDAATYRLLTPADVAARWAVPEAWVRELVAARPDLPVIDFTALRPGRLASRRGDGTQRAGPREYRFRPEDLAAWEAGLAGAPTTAATAKTTTQEPPPPSEWDGVRRLRTAR